ncbi:hypothetical protein ACFL2A_00625 [Thermodesulfobacteriota bacterium]
MSEVIYESVERVTKRKVYLLDEVSGSQNPLYLGSKFIGQEVLISGVVKGSDYDDAKSGLEALEDECKLNEEKTVMNITGKIIALKSMLKPGSSYQPFTITLGVYA